MIPEQDKLDEVYEALRSIFETSENEMNMYVNFSLFDYINRDNWDKLALSTDKLKSIEEELKKRGYLLKNIQLKALNNVFKVLALEDQMEAKDMAEQLVNENMKLLITSSTTKYKNEIKQVKKVWSLKKDTQNLYNSMLKQANKGFEKGLSVVYNNNRIVSYKAYMEMLVRTTISQAITKQQMELGETTKTVFYICNSFGDCADDHAELQGKVYYDERYRDFGYKHEFVLEIEKAIKKKDMMSVQDVQEHIRTERKGNRKIEIGYLTTRPNCRHRLVPITLEQALGEEIKVLKELHLKKGMYKDTKYQTTQELRRCERNIRTYRDQAFLNQKIQEKGLFKGSKEAQELATRYRKLAKAWELKAEALVNNHSSWLKRDKDRETTKLVIQDLGIKYTDPNMKKLYTISY